MEDDEKINFENVNELNKFFPYVLDKIKNETNIIYKKINLNNDNGIFKNRRKFKNRN